MSADGILAGIATLTARGILPEGPSAASAVGGPFALQRNPTLREEVTMLPINPLEIRNKKKRHKKGKK
jgi:hypothetical protein